MAGQVNPEERRAYEDGARDQKISEHGAHLDRINGQIGVLAESSRTANVKLDEVLAEMPRVLTVAEEAEKAKIVAVALAKKTSDERSFLERWKNHLMFGLMTMIALLTLGSWASRVLGTPTPATPPAQTVTEIISP